MWIVAIGWMYVAIMMTVVEALSPHGSALAAVGMFFFYGVFPVAILMYVLGAPRRGRAQKVRMAQAPSNEEAACESEGHGGC